MRLTRIYQMFDLEAQCVHGPIFTEGRDQAAIRSFGHVLKQDKTLPGEYPEQFELRCLGVQNEQNGEITAEQPPVVIATGKQWLDKQNRDDTCDPVALSPEHARAIERRK